jgi:uncharacterized membrane protein YhaH (DUF805 family)
MNYFKHYFLDIIIKKYAQFRGRASRKEFWNFVLLSFIISFIAGMAGTLLEIQYMIPIESVEFVKETGKLAKTITYIPLNLLPLGIGAIMFIPSLAISIRRLHDLGKSGKWYFIIFIPFIGLVVLFIFFLQSSESRTNRHGTIPH